MHKHIHICTNIYICACISIHARTHPCDKKNMDFPHRDGSFTVAYFFDLSFDKQQIYKPTTLFWSAGIPMDINGYRTPKTEEST